MNGSAILVASAMLFAAPAISQADPAADSGRRFTVVFFESVVAELDSLSEMPIDREQIRCLLGTLPLTQDSLLVTAVWDPGIKWAEIDGVQARRPCPARITVGEWHTHLALAMPEASVCELSNFDRQEARKNQRQQVERDGTLLTVLFMVQISSRTRCAWLLSGDRFILVPW